tara:strand:+ start:3497 stop:4279 length:783 start_codon:yes stop_codon:yes gene_type:complete
MLVNFQAEQEYREQGFTVIKNAYEEDLLLAINNEVENLLDIYKPIQTLANVIDSSAGAMHHTILVSELQHNLIKPFRGEALCKKLLNSEITLASFGTCSVRSDKHVYTQKIHRDARSLESSNSMINIIIPLCDSIHANGATRIISGSHLDDVQIQPSEEIFDKNAMTIETRLGDMILFNPYCWHRSGVNNTNLPRNVITMMVVSPWIKPSLDYSKAFGYDKKYTYSKSELQLLGYNSRVPSSLEEYYKVPELRYYQSNQG